MADPYAVSAEVRAYESALSSTDQYTDAYLTDLIAEFEAIAEEYVGVAYAVRNAVETFALPSTVRALCLAHWPVVAVASITANGTALDSTTDYAVTLSNGMVTFANLANVAFQFGVYGRTVVVTYTYGHPAPPVMLKRACLEYVRSVALQKSSGVSRDITYQSMDGMTTRYTPAPDRDAGTPTGYRDVDRILNILRQRSPAVA